MSIKATFALKGKKLKNVILRVRTVWGGAQDGWWMSVVDIFDAAELAQNPSPRPLDKLSFTTPYEPGMDGVQLTYKQVKVDMKFDAFEDV